MKKFDINIVQGISTLEYADVNIIIDVIRAFTVSYYAFQAGVGKIILVSTEEEANRIKKENYVTSGEVNGYKIESFDFGNSPYDISKAELHKKNLLQRTTNGVKVTLSSLNADHIFVTGFINSLSLVNYIKFLRAGSQKEIFKVNIIASHPSGQDDYACANYIKKHLLDKCMNHKLCDEEIVYKIIKSDAAQKFFEEKNLDFSINDIIMSLSIENSNFVMEVNKNNEYVEIHKRIQL